MDLTQGVIYACWPHVTPTNLGLYALGLLKAAQDIGAVESTEIVKPRRLAAFLAQIAHESGELRYSEEIWGPTPAQLKYEGNKLLGNTQPGDGFRYRGRGLIQLTGRTNYALFSNAIGNPSLLAFPDLVAEPWFGSRAAAWYWNTHRCSEYADVGDFDKVTRAVNGGLNGKQSRDNYYTHIRKVLKC